MAINPRTDLQVEPFVPPSRISEQELLRQLLEVFQSLAQTLGDVAEASPKVADAPPASPRRGTIRLAVSPWNPLSGTPPYWVWWNGSAWVAL